MGSVPHMEPNFLREEIPLDSINGWAPEVAMSGSLGLLLSVYQGMPSSPSPFHVCTNTTSSSADGEQPEPELLWDATIAVDRDITAHDFLKSIVKSYHQNTNANNTSAVAFQPAASLQSFLLRTDSLENWTAAASNSASSSEGPSAIPHQILCTVLADSNSLVLEISGPESYSSSSARFLSQLAHTTQQLLSAALYRTGSSLLRDLNLLCNLDRQDLTRWNGPIPTTISSTVHETIHQRVVETPDATAVDSWDGSLSYAELDTLSSQVCSVLSAAGARQGDCIPLCFEKTVWTVVAMLGVLKSGCSFLLMDVSHPNSRLQTLARECNATILLSSEAQQDRAATLGVAQAIVISPSTIPPSTCTSPTGPPSEQHHHNKIEVGVSANDVAAVIFTSGTTGTPKGIQLEHKSMCSSLSALASFSNIGRHTRYFQFSSYAFDAGFGEILMTLMHGGTICIPSDADRLNRLAESMRGFRANAVLLTPTVVRLLQPDDVPCLQTLISGGERVTSDIISLWGDRLDLIVIYGPAETTVGCVLKHTRPTPGFDDGAVRIGHAVNTRAWVARLDDPSKLAPVGAIGELVAEGPGIGRGYLNNEKGNKELFFERPPWSEEMQTSGVPEMGRCYRTGDLVRFADDGELIFIGRRDRQVKLRGQRIELEDIETKLKQHFKLTDANIVVEVLDTQGVANLVAFLHHSRVRDAAQMPEDMDKEIQALRERISEVLPAYMWPIAWIPLPELPLGPTGKLDRRKLLGLGQDFFSSRIQPGDGDGDGVMEDKGLSPVESVLAAMWRQLLPSALGLTPEANFFQLGGDSLRCMKLVGLARKGGFHLTMEKVFTSPALSGMAAAMQQLPADESAHTSVFSSASAQSYALGQGDTSKFWSLLQEYGLGHEQVEGVFPCTPLQAGLFSLSMAMPTLYSSQFVFELSAAVDMQKFKAAWESALAAFPILRTAIAPSSSSLVQFVLRHHADWTDVSQDLASFLAADKAVSFQPGQPLSRTWHVQDPSSGQSHFVWTLHHAVFDGWSLETVVDHIRQVYHSQPVEPTTGTFQEFVQFCDALNLDECAPFWKEQLENAPQPSFPSFPKAGHLAADSSCLKHTMTAPSAGTTTTTTTVLARAAWALLLSEYEGSDDVTFGNSLHGRNSLPPRLQDVVGPTITTLPIRVRIDHAQTVLGFLDGLQEQFSAMIPYEQFGLSRILGIDQRIQNAASFRTLLIVQVADVLGDKQGIRLDEVERSLHEYPLVLTLMPGTESQKIELVATFDSEVISAAQVQRILYQFEQTFHQLSTAAAGSDAKVGDLDLASNADKATMFGWNARHHKAYEVCVHDIIRERTRHYRALPAIYSRDGEMDYGTLDKLSDNLAGEMVRSAHVKPGDVVGVLFEKSQWAIVSILAVVKCGAAYAPFSPAYPRARLEGIASDAGIKLVLCSPTQEESFPDPMWQTLVVSDETAYSFAASAPMARVATPESLLYILSTSGTTGTPKIFGVQHKAFATGAMARAALFRRGTNSRVLQFAPFAFDPSVEDIFTTLMFGGCICVPSDEDIMGDISAFMKTAQVNFANITPSVAYTLKENELPDFKMLLLSGEAPDQALVDKWANSNTGVQVMNGYGPSECSVKCAINTNLTREAPRNIGHSAGTSIWVLRPGNNDRLTPLGGVGELVIESPHLSSTGYMNRPEANDKFMESPTWLREFRDSHVTRMYKTGDLVRYMEDGSILYIGRGDMQLKLHGQRLEAEETRQRIQEALASNGQHQLQVIVDIARFKGQDSDVLVAYLAQKGESSHRGGEMDMDEALQQHLADMKEHIVREIGTALPKYMIPSVFLALANIPVTSNGKADRRALKSFAARTRLGPQFLSSSGEETITPPTTETEKVLHNLWQELLGLDGDRFGASSNFFELGGSSLAAIKLASAARDLGHNLSAQIIFKNPVLSAMASQMTPLRETNKTTAGPARFTLLSKIDRTVHQLKKTLETYKIDVEEEVEDAYPLTRQQRRYMEGEMVSPGGTTHRHIMQLPSNIDSVRLENALYRVVSANAILRTRIISASSQLVQVVLKNDVNPIRRVDSLSLLADADRKVSWGLGQPLSRFSIVDGGEGKYLVWSSAHVVFDGWCRRLLLQDIDYAYHHDSNPSARPQYNTFIEFVYSSSSSVADEEEGSVVRDLEQNHAKFFRYFSPNEILTKVPGITHTLSLAIDFPAGAALPAGLSYPTTMLTAWAIAASDVESGHDSQPFLFNLLLGGRDANLTGVDKVLGPVSSTAPFATSISPSSTFRENMQAIQTAVDQAASLQHVVRFGTGPAGDKLRELLAAVPVVVVHPAEDYEEAKTEYSLGLVRDKVETVTRLVDAMFMNFCLKYNGEQKIGGVELIMTVDERFFAVERGVRYFGAIERVLKGVLKADGAKLDGVVGELAGAGAGNGDGSETNKVVVSEVVV
ncbi:hypothetical protein QBC40DRAFT_286889 [Triangularia verruculosa]|uniref:Carrier domain-containing protein n=1 Tax=Triangularia verruculosa TaxID=2587418 RepID=A0AAN6XF75_9PEZI|nr:hypothetical protein QBC40DRAFT_286889 [Triangularia verruculosa]